jgi:hypothetical protein
MSSFGMAKAPVAKSAIATKITNRFIIPISSMELSTLETASSVLKIPPVM